MRRASAPSGPTPWGTTATSAKAQWSPVACAPWPGLAEVEVKEENRFLPDRLVLSETGPGPGEGKLGALAMAIGHRLRGAEPTNAATST